MDAHGAPQQAVPIRIQQNGRLVATATTDAAGRFGVNGVRAGLYQIPSERASATAARLRTIGDQLPRRLMSSCSLSVS